MDRREGTSGRRLLKQELLENMSSCSYSNFAKDKENSEPMDIGSPTCSVLTDQSQIDSPRYPTASQNLSSTNSSSRGEAIQDIPELSQVQFTPPPHQKTGSNRSSAVNLPAPAVPDGTRSGTPQSLSQLINLPNSAFSFDLPDSPAPGGSGLISPLGSGKLGKKRPLSISPLSSSSINIETLVRGSPTSLLNFIANSRNSSAGSFGHLSPSLYATPVVHNSSFNRPSISLSKAIHPSSLSNGGTANELGEGFQEKHCEDHKITSELADIPDHRVNIQPIMKASMEQDSEGDTNLPMEPNSSDYRSSELPGEMEGKYQKSSRRIYYAYPAVEQPHNNCCMWENCQHQCESLDQLVTHVNTEHIYQESRKEFVCRWSGCVRDGRPFKAQYMLLVHMRRHTGEKPHRCHYEGCEKAYSRLENLKTHLRSHTGEKPYLCKYEGCGKAFSNASDCAKHMNRTHSDEKPYACLNPGCTKRYTDPSSRRKHMKNCQVNKKARTGLDDLITEEGGSLEAPPMGNVAKPSPQSNKKTSKSRKSEKKKREEGAKPHMIEFPSQNDMGYISGESQCTPILVGSVIKGNRTQLSGYNSSGYDTEYPSLNEDHSVPPLISVLSDHSDQFYDHQEVIKTEQFSPGDHMSYQLSQPPPAYTNGHHHYKVPNLQPLPEIQQYRQIGGGGGGYYQQSTNIMETHSSGYSSFGGSPLINNDDSISLINSYSSGHRSIKGSDLTSSSHSSFVSQLSSPATNNHSEYSKVPTHSYRNLRPPDLILRPQHQPYSVQISDIKPHPPYYRHSDEMSLRSSHSSRYSMSGSEFSDDLTRHGAMAPPPLPPPDVRSSPRDPLPLPQSMQTDYMIMSDVTTDPQSQYIVSSPYNYTAAGSIPLQHYEPKSVVLPMIYESSRAESPSNMVLGNMNRNASQLHQDTLLFEGLTPGAPPITTSAGLLHQ